MKDLRKALEELLTREQSSFDPNAIAAIEGVWFWDMERPEIEWKNSRFLKVLGYSPEEAKANKNFWEEVIYKKDLSAALEAFQVHCKSPSKPYDQIVRYRHKLDYPVYIRGKGQAQKDKNTKKLRFLGSHSIATELMNVQTAYKKLSQRYQHILEGSGSCIWEWNIQTGECLLNGPWNSLTGWIPGETGPQTTLAWFAHIHKEDLPAFQEHLDKHFQNLTEGIDFELRLQHTSGSWVWVQLKGKLVTRTPDANPEKITGLALNINQAKTKLEQYKNFIRDAPLAMAIHDKELNYLAASKRWMVDYDLTGNIVGRHHYEVFPEIPERWKEIHRQALTGKRMYADEDFFERQDGRIQWMRWEIQPWYEEDGNLGGLIFFSEDITERKEKEATIRNLSLIAENTDNPVILANQNREVEYANPALEKLTGITLAQLSKKNPVPLLLEKGFKAPELKEIQNRLAQSKSYSGEISILDKEGNRKWFLLQVSKFLEESTDIEKVFAIGTDITDRILLDNKLKEEQKFLSSVLEYNTSAIVVLNKEGQITYSNSAAEKVLGRTKEEIVKKEFNHPQWNLTTLNGKPLKEEEYPFSIVMNTGQPIKNCQVRLMWPDGSFRILNINGAPIKWDKNKPDSAVFSFIDMTEEVHALNALESSFKKNQAIIEAIPDLIFVVNQEGVILDYSAKDESGLYTGPDLFLGKNFVQILPKNAVSQILPSFENLLISGKTTIAVYELEIEGNTKTYEARFSLISNIEALCLIRDISKETETQKALEYSESLLKGLLQISNVGIALNDFQSGQFIQVNDAFCKLTGYSETELLNKTYHDLTPENFILAEAEQIATLKSKKSYGPYEKEYIRKDGHSVPVLLRGQLVHDLRGNPRIWSVISDISKRKEQERQLTEQRNIFHWLYELSAGFIQNPDIPLEQKILNGLEKLGLNCHADRVCIYHRNITDGSVAQTFSWARSGYPFSATFTETVPESYFTELLEKHRKGLPFNQADFEVLKTSKSPIALMAKKDGIFHFYSHPIWEKEALSGFLVLANCQPKTQFEEKDATLASLFAGFYSNILDRNNAERQHLLREERYRNLLENMNMGLLEVDPEDRIEFINEQFEKISGYTKKELSGRNFTRLFIPREHRSILQSKNELRKLGISDSYEVVSFNKSGEARWWLLSGAPKYDEQGKFAGSIVVALDITEQKELETVLEKALLASNAASEAKEAFLANMSHEIRTPLHGIIGLLRELDKEPMNPVAASYVENARKTAQHLQMLVSNILDLSKIEANEFHLEESHFNPLVLLEQTVNLLTIEAKQKGLVLTKNIDPSLASAFKGDSVRLKQILLNVMGNAIKFTEKGNVTLTVIVESENDSQQNLSITVADTGIGMTEQFLRTLFTKFQQEDTGGGRKYGGTGLGMVITKQLVELMGGSIEVKSEKGVGTTVQILLSYQKGDPAKVSGTVIAFPGEWLADYKVLLAEDNEMNRLVAKKALEPLGIQITEVETGLAAIEKLKEATFDLILMDIQMPEMDGLEATQIIRNELQIDTPIIALSANALQSEVEKCLRSGMNQYLVKPFEEYDLVNMVASALKKNPRHLPSPTNLSQSHHAATLQQEGSLFNLDKLTEYSKGDTEFVTKMLEIFIRQTPPAVEQIEAAIREKKEEPVRKILHRLKASVHQLGAKEIYNRILELEKSLQVNQQWFQDAQDICKRLRHLTEELKKI